MTSDPGRRALLRGAGVIGLGSLLAACRDSGPRSAPTALGPSPTSSAAAALLDAAGTCELSPEQVEGPYFFDVEAIRADLREDREGAPLELALRVRGSDCRPLVDAVVDLWHCDAGGLYSGFESASRGGPLGKGPSDEQTYLRGAQVTGADGVVTFTTVFPGWYPGRAVHLHAKVHLDRTRLIATQLYFDEAVTDAAHAGAPYDRRGPRDVRNTEDGFFDPRLVVASRRAGEGWLSAMTLQVGA